MKIYNFKQRIDQTVYFKIFDYALKIESKMVFVETNNAEIDPLIKESILPFIIKQERVFSWPGTVTHPLNKEKAKGNMIFISEINPELIEKIKLLRPSLWDWQWPKSPEDLSFLRPNGTPWFVSITHEDDAYVELEDGELKAFTDYFGNDLIEYFKEDETVTKYL